MKYIEELKEAIRRKDVILFVGAGVSKNLGLPTFSELIDEVANLIGYDPEIFKTLSNYQSLVEFYYLNGTILMKLSWMLPPFIKILLI